MSTDRDALAEALHERLCADMFTTGGPPCDNCREDADALLASLARLIAAAKAEGIVQGRGELRSAESAAFKRGLEAADHAVCGDCAAAEARGAARVREAVEGLADRFEAERAWGVGDLIATELRAALAAETPTESAEREEQR